jgi:hypothetical protein
MSQNPETSTNPGSVNVADQGDGLLSVDQPVTVGPSYNPGPLVQAGSKAPGTGPDSPDQPVTSGPSSNPGPTVQAGSAEPGTGPASPDQPVTTGPSQNSGQLVQAGTASPTSPRTTNTTQNNVAGQVYGQGTPANVFV